MDLKVLAGIRFKLGDQGGLFKKRCFSGDLSGKDKRGMHLSRHRWKSLVDKGLGLF